MTDILILMPGGGKKVILRYGNEKLSTSLGDVTDLPSPKEMIRYVVSTMIARMISRADILAIEREGEEYD